MTTYLGKSCSFGLPRVPFVNCRQFMYLIISLLVLRAGCGIWLCRFLIVACLFTFHDKTNKMICAPSKDRLISLGIRQVWSESSLCTQWVAKDPVLLQADREDSDQTGRIPRLIWAFAGHTDHFGAAEIKIWRGLGCKYDCVCILRHAPLFVKPISFITLYFMASGLMNVFVQFDTKGELKKQWFPM